jgi:hypothetical protein
MDAVPLTLGATQGTDGEETCTCLWPAAYGAQRRGGGRAAQIAQAGGGGRLLRVQQRQRVLDSPVVGGF